MPDLWAAKAGPDAKPESLQQPPQPPKLKTPAPAGLFVIGFRLAGARFDSLHTRIQG
jgi:hypothetical protein